MRPDLPRLYDEARTDFLIDHLVHEAGNLVGDEVVEAGRTKGEVVRAVGRLAGGGIVAALVTSAETGPDAALEREVAELHTALGGPVHKLVYTLVGEVERPLGVRVEPHTAIQP